MSRHRVAIAIAAVIAAATPAAAYGQARKVKILAPDNSPIPYAYVTVEGGIGQISDENGEVAFGAGKKQTVTVRIQRIGYQPWFGKLDLPDTAVTFTVPLSPIAQNLSAVAVKGTAAVKSLQLTGFYDRWMMRQKGMLSAVFIGPEELEFRHPDRITNMLRGLNSIFITQACVEPPDRGRRCVRGLAAFQNTSMGCPMAIVIDGIQQHPLQGANVNIDMLLDAGSAAGIEVYARGGNMPIGFQFQDMGCGVLAFWTGSRKP